MVDDFAYIQLLFKRSLGKEGFEVFVAKTAAEAAEHLGRESFDLIVIRQTTEDRGVQGKGQDRVRLRAVAAASATVDSVSSMAFLR